MDLEIWVNREASLSQSESGVVNQVAFLPRSKWKVSKGLLYLNLELWRPRGFSTLIWMKGIQGASLPRNLSYGDQRASLPRSLMKGNQGASLPQTLDCGDQGASLSWSWWKVTMGLLYLRTWIVATKGLLYLDLDER